MSHKSMSRRARGAGTAKLSTKLGVSAATLSAKIAKVNRDHPEKSPRQAAGMAAGILRGRRK